MLTYFLAFLFIFLPNHLYALKTKNNHNAIASDLIYPKEKKTPGDIFPYISEEDVCTPGYAKKARKVSCKTKREIKNQYKIPTHLYDNFIIDHYIPLSLGGTNEIKNLWPQPKYGAAYVADDKARSDTFLFNEVCAGRMTLERAQQLILEDWVAVFEACCVKNNYDSKLLSLINFPYQAKSAASIIPS